MASWKIITIMCIATVYAESSYQQRIRREMKQSICDPMPSNTSKVQCFCGRSRTPLHIVNADCYQKVKNVSQDDPSWEDFVALQNISKLTLTNTQGVAINYVPTNALKHTKSLLKLDIKYCNIERIEPYAFANLSNVKDIILRDNQIRMLAPNAFAHHPRLQSLSLDQNNIAELNRNVFVDLPSLEKLFLTGNKITTVHDRAFIHLTNLKELEIDKNRIFSLNSETFSGLRNLVKLELSSNSLEVIGDNTFMPLVSLRYLNLDENKIQMLDEKAFNGLHSLEFLSLPRNKIMAIDNEKVFEPLIALNSLNLKDNDIRMIKPEAIASLLKKFYNTSAQIVIEGNHLPCHCNLDAFKSIINNTKNARTNLEIQNLKCYPSDEVKQQWDKLQETEKSSGQVFEDEEMVENVAYEYYDDTELNGTLFYFDIRHFLNCSNEKDSLPSDTFTASKTYEKSTDNQLKPPSSPAVAVTSTTPELLTDISTKVSNRGTLDLSTVDATTEVVLVAMNKTMDAHNEIPQKKSFYNDERRKEKKDYTTSRLATVSAKPVDAKGFDDHDMASDEAKPDRIKAHRSVQEELKDSPKHKSNNACRQIRFVPTFVLMMLCFRVLL